MTSACVMLTYVSLGTRILDPYPTPSLVMDPESPTFNKFISRAPVLSGALGFGGWRGHSFVNRHDYALLHTMYTCICMHIVVIATLNLRNYNVRWKTKKIRVM